MKIINKRIFVIIAAAIGLLSCSQTHAAFVFGNGAATINQGGDFILGNNFVVNTPITVNQLGVFSQDAPADPTIPIAIYQHSGSDPTSGWTLVAGTSQSITSLDPVDVANQTRYINIAPVTLAPGLYSVVTATSSDYNSGNGNRVSSAITFNTLGGALTLAGFDIWNYYTPGSGLGGTLSGMGTTGPGDPNYPWPVPVFGAGTFAVVPEASTLMAGALLLLPFGASTLRILRRNRTA